MRLQKREDGLISVLNLEHKECAMVINDACEMIETNMDEIEQGIVINLAKKNIGFMSVAISVGNRDKGEVQDKE